MLDGTSIKERRLELGLTQQDLADKVYVTRQTISKWELNKSQPDAIAMNLLYQALHLPKAANEEISVAKSNAFPYNIFTLPIFILIGPLSFAFRYVYIELNKPEHKLTKIILIGTFIPLGLIYLNSLLKPLFYLAIAIITLLYFSIQLYFYFGNKEDN
ncbi:helix-turn-helix transcriptional regulator [Vaginisenegalia massiliensis]|uniref:helix-turn-helix transcriptional regulator n=1 Tax=Vaginisenegalia massiliensis TaxID=2058294 RepID=UPI000F523A36|nr:helix-turn-helix transcriptional regulator [Vaginisenegalia massiliensis]